MVLLAAGAFGGGAWYLLRRVTPGERTEIDDVVWGGAPSPWALMLELTTGGFGIMIPMVAATVTATVVARHVDGYSIYTARLRAR